MRKYRLRIIIIIFLIIIMIVFQPDVMTGVRAGLVICFSTVIPSLFPLAVFSNYLTDLLLGIKVKVLLPLNRLCGMPIGTESLFLVGCIGGYPLGAKAVADTYNKKLISKQTAERLLAFCNNAGPAFVFGMGITLFNSLTVCTALYMIQLIGAFITGCLLHKNKQDLKAVCVAAKPSSFTQSISGAIRAMVGICGSIVLFKVMINLILERISGKLPVVMEIILIGVLELSNATIGLHRISEQAIRFVLLSGFLSFGGLCVALQTQNLVGDLNTDVYICGKIMQCSICVILSTLVQQLLFEKSLSKITGLTIVLISGSLIFGIYMYLKRKNTGKY